MVTACVRSVAGPEARVTQWCGRVRAATLVTNSGVVLTAGGVARADWVTLACIVVTKCCRKQH